MYTATFLQDPDFIRLLYILAFALFIIDLRLMNHPRTARKGNVLGAIGMAIAVVATLLIESVGDYGLIALGVVVGTAVGVPAARSVKMTAMPQMVALFNGVGGGAVALISFVEYREALAVGGNPELDALIPALFAAIIGSVSFWGSNIAFGKLQEVIPGRPIQLPGQVFINVGLLAVCVGCAIAIASGTESEGLFILILVAAAVLGNMFVLPIGGADMPVVISLLNAFTGLSAPAAGLALDNVALIVAGMLVGASGSILTLLMAEAMNRSLANIFRGGFGGTTAVAADAEGRSVRSTDPADVAIQLAYARRVVVVPGYGLAVAQAQHTVRDLANQLEQRGVDVAYAIHPVAGR
ncbi:MAG TPA: NAD(P)(+) transhydrogenase (Re/Si-specific) subunit beta, partial [Thermoleophilaceae bacterium]